MLAGVGVSLFALLKKPDSFKYFTMISFSILYTVALFEAGNDFMFVLMFPIIMMYVLYFDYKFILMTSAFLALANISDVIYTCAVIGEFRSGMSLEVPVLLLRMGSVLISLAALIGTTKRANKNNSTKIANVKAEQEKSQQLVDVIVPVVKTVSDNSIDITNAMDTLYGNVDSTAKLLNSISTYSERTTESINSQTERTAAIHEKIQNAKLESDKMIDLSNKSSKAVSNGFKVVEQLILQAKESKEANDKVVTSVEALIKNAENVAEMTSQISNESISADSNLTLEKTAEAVELSEECKSSTIDAKSKMDELSQTVHKVDSYI